MRLGFIKSSFLTLMLCSCTKKLPETLTLYLASSLVPLAEDLQKLSKEKLDLIFLSSSALVRQIEKGAPCDGAIVADEAWMKALIKSRKVDENYKPWAKNSLVLASRIPKSQKPVNLVLKELSEGQKIVIADESFVPLGAYTKEALTALGLFDGLSARFVRVHSARQASITLKQGLASYGILYKTDALLDKLFIVGDFLENLYAPIIYPYLACIKSSPSRRKLLKKLLFSKEMEDKLKEKGFILIPR